jgi:two-component system nitrogen regulation sensor histidine kinase NtrY
MRKGPRKRVRFLYEHRISLYALFVALPGALASGIFIWFATLVGSGSKFGLSLVELFAWWVLALVLHEQTVRPLQTLANVVAALREEDYSFRARGATADDALGELSLEVNALSRPALGSANSCHRSNGSAAPSRRRNRCPFIRI